MNKHNVFIDIKIYNSNAELNRVQTLVIAIKLYEKLSITLTMGKYFFLKPVRSRWAWRFSFARATHSNSYGQPSSQLVTC